MVGSLILEPAELAHELEETGYRKVDHLIRNLSITRRSLDHDPA